MLSHAAELVIETHRLLNLFGSLRAGLPNAYNCALRFLERADVPPAAQDAYGYIINEMSRGLEVHPGKGLVFLDGITDEEVTMIGCAFWKLAAAILIAHTVAQIEAKRVAEEMQALLIQNLFGGVASNPVPPVPRELKILTDWSPCSDKPAN